MPFRVRQQSSFKRNYIRREENSGEINWVAHTMASSFKTKAGAETFARDILRRYPTIRLFVEEYRS